MEDSHLKNTIVKGVLDGEAEPWNYVCLDCNGWAACDDSTEDSIVHSHSCEAPQMVVVTYRLRALEHESTRSFS